jgi:cereblon
MVEPYWILEREWRQVEQILELDNEELQVEEVDDGSSSSSDVDTFLRYKNTPHPFLNFSS